MNETSDAPKRSMRSVFLAALMGGLVVALAGYVAIAAGWIGKEQTTVQSITAASTPVSNKSNTNLVNQIYNRDKDGVGFITASGISTGSSNPFDPYGQQGTGTATGSGFLIDTDGNMVTNNHVIEGAKKITVTLGDSDQVFDASVVGTDPSTDLALIKVDAPKEDMKPLSLGDSSSVKVGDPVVAIGNPFGLDRTVTTGIVSALQREISSLNQYAISNVIQTDAAINPGNSGGPLIDSEGNVIGVNSQIATGGSNGSSGGNVGIGFAIPSNTVKDVVDQLKDGGTVEHAYLGISAATINPQIADALNLGTDQGALVQEAPKDGPAAKAGIKAGDTQVSIGGQQVLAGGDVVTKVNGKDLSSMEDLIAAVNDSKVGDKMELEVLRDGKTETVTVTLGKRPDNTSSNESSSSEPAPMPQFGQ